jgi:metal-dependent amidase/aminoacylase/carboxypeptidase family protein
MNVHRDDESESSSAASAFAFRIRDVLPDLERVYTDIHAHPELSMQETRTAGIAADRLRAAGFEVTPGVGTTGVVGMLRDGDGPTIMLRAHSYRTTLRRELLIMRGASPS